jgi:hypothetical protein
MDLEGRTREFFAAHRGLDPARILPFVAADVRVDYVGLEQVDRAGLERMLEAMHGNLGALGFGSVEFRLQDVVARRNVTFAQWSCVVERPGRRPVEYPGVHVLVWDRDGLVKEVTVYTDPEPLRRLAVGSHTVAAGAA